MERISSPGGARSTPLERAGDDRRRAAVLPFRRGTVERAETVSSDQAFQESRRQFLALHQEVQRFLQEARKPPVSPGSDLEQALHIEWSNAAALDELIGRLDHMARRWYALKLVMPWKRKEYEVTQNVIRQLMEYRKRAQAIEEKQTALFKQSS